MQDTGVSQRTVGCLLAMRSAQVCRGAAVQRDGDRKPMMVMMIYDDDAAAANSKRKQGRWCVV